MSCERNIFVELIDKLTNERFFEKEIEVFYPECSGCLDLKNTSFKLIKGCEGNWIGNITVCESSTDTCLDPISFDMPDRGWVGVDDNLNIEVKVKLNSISE
jgi:hypothetical protein